MNLAPDEDQQELAKATAMFLARKLPLDRLREAVDRPLGQPALDRAEWTELAGLGVLGLTLPSETGGAGYGLSDEVVVFRELGRGLAAGPLLGTALAAWLAAGAGETALAAALTSGERRAGVLIDEATAMDAYTGDLALRLDVQGASLHKVEKHRARAGVDPTVELTDVDIGAPVVTREGPGAAARARLLNAAMLVGMAEATTQMSVAYGKERVQYGRPIGAFQAVKHRCVDMAMGAYTASAQLLYAAHQAQHGHPDGEYQAACALLLAMDAAVHNAAVNVQNHGAIGFTAEHHAHLFVKRARVLEHVLGPRSAVERDVLAVDGGGLGGSNGGDLG